MYWEDRALYVARNLQPDGNDNVKKAISKTKTLHVYHTILYISLPPPGAHDYDVSVS